MVDGVLASSNTRQLLSHNLGRISHRYAPFGLLRSHVLATHWGPTCTGQLYLGVFSGPVEGILMIVAIFIISGRYGT